MNNYSMGTTQQYNTPTQRLTLEQQYNQLANGMLNQNQQPQSNPYNDYIATLNSCSDVSKQRILTDPRFENIYSQCEAILKEYLYTQVMPYVLETQGGKIAFEKLLATTRGLKEEFTQKDLQKEKLLESLMNDEVVLRRLQELQNGEKFIETQTVQQTNVQSNTKQNNKNNQAQNNQPRTKNEVIN